MKRNGFVMLAVLSCAPALSWAKTLEGVATTRDLAAIADEMGGKNVHVTAIAKGYQDPHFVDAKPSYLLKLKKADLYIQVGLELEVGWAPGLLSNARNAKILPGNLGFLEASEGCDILEKRNGNQSLGNYWPTFFTACSGARRLATDIMFTRF